MQIKREKVRFSWEFSSPHNPEVVGSSPASATIKNTGIHYEYRFFLIFRVVLKTALLSFWNNFGTVTAKIIILEHRPGTPGGFLCLFSEQHIRNTLRCSGLVLFDNMAVEAFCGVHAGMA